MWSIITLLGLLTGLIATTAHASVLTPNVLPLVVRNPYLSFWLKNGRDVPWSSWPIFWTGQPVGMSLLASVPDSNTVYPLLGRPQDFLNGDGDGYKLAFPLYKGAQFDASTTNFTYQIPGPADKEPAELKITFFSPITPTSSLRQSIPASYVSIAVEGEFDIDVYMDLNGDWVSGDNNNAIKWFIQSVEFDETGALWSWQVQRDQPQSFSEIRDRAEWGTLHFSGPADVNYQSGAAGDVRSDFAKNSKLLNRHDDRFRNINDAEPVFAFHKSFKLGSATQSHSDSVLFTIAHTQDEIVQFASARGLTMMRPMWHSWFFSEYSLIMFHYLDHHNAIKLASNYSAQLEHDAYKSGGQDYVDIVALSARQVIGGTSFSGTAESPLIFLKEIASNGNTQTVDVIFPAFPFFQYTNPRWLAYLLEPLLEHQLSGQYPNRYCMHDLGQHFPNLTGHADGNDEYMPLEESGDMLIMGLSLVNSLRYDVAEKATSIWSSLGGGQSSTIKSKGTPFPIEVSRSTADNIFGLDDAWGGGERGEEQAKKWLERSYKIWEQWTEFLIDESLEPRNQLSTDDFAGWLPLHSNLALKGIVGIRAMSELASVSGRNSEAKYYRNISDTYASKWHEYAMARDGKHVKLAYNWYGSWTTLYSLFADSQLCFHLDSNDGTLEKSANSKETTSDDKPDGKTGEEKESLRAKKARKNNSPSYWRSAAAWRDQQRAAAQAQKQAAEEKAKSSPSSQEVPTHLRPYDQAPLSYDDEQDSSDYEHDSTQTTPTQPRRSRQPRPLNNHTASANLLPHSLYHAQTHFYPLALQRYGLPLDSRALLAKTDWLMQVAAVSSPSLRKELNHRLAYWVNNTVTDMPFVDIIMTEDPSGNFGRGIHWGGRPVVGSHFSRLLVERSCGGLAVKGLEGLE
ncbi:MAG: hypothetical protein M1831_000286 [Alyxoria varia]|nr:MAG: hypothetical protein M1831_000286 [Alyxoria varia]